MRKAQLLREERQAFSQSVPHAQSQQPVTPLGLGEALVHKRVLPSAPSTPMVDKFTKVKDGALIEKARVLTSFGDILRPHFVAKEERQQSPVRGRQRAPHESVEREKGGFFRSPVEANILGGLHLEWVRRKAASPKSAPMAVTLPGPRQLTRHTAPLTRAVRREDTRLPLVELGCRLKPQIGSSLKEPRLLSKVSLPLQREMGPGKPLAPRPRRTMERLLGGDLGDVRVHSEPAAARTAADLKAEAFTVGREIFFGRGKAKFNTVSGMALLAHELTHVARRRGIYRPASSSLLRAQAEEKEASDNELAVRQVLQDRREPLAPWPGRLTLGLCRPPRSESTTTSHPGGLLMDASSMQASPSVRPSAPPMELVKAPVGRPTPTESPAPPTPSPPTEPEAPQREKKELDLDAMARQVYDLIMRRLTVERERIGYR